jgi:DNA-binding transcriptional LysR family regulator
MSRKLPSLNALHAFEAAARLESVTRAASELHVTHGAVSRQIKALEADLGKALFTREGRGLALTPAGMRLRDATGAAFQQLEESWSDLRRDSAPSALVLGCPGSVLARWVIPRLPRLSRELPELKLHLVVHEGDFDARLGEDRIEFLDERGDDAQIVGRARDDDGIAAVVGCDRHERAELGGAGARAFDDGGGHGGV